jgi:hypothetical protein
LASIQSAVLLLTAAEFNALTSELEVLGEKLSGRVASYMERIRDD